MAITDLKKQAYTLELYLHVNKLVTNMKQEMENVISVIERMQDLESYRKSATPEEIKYYNDLKDFCIRLITEFPSPPKYVKNIDNTLDY